MLPHDMFQSWNLILRPQVQVLNKRCLGLRIEKSTCCFTCCICLWQPTLSGALQASRCLCDAFPVHNWSWSHLRRQKLQVLHFVRLKLSRTASIPRFWICRYQHYIGASPICSEGLQTLHITSKVIGHYFRMVCHLWPSLTPKKTRFECGQIIKAKAFTAGGSHGNNHCHVFLGHSTYSTLWWDLSEAVLRSIVTVLCQIVTPPIDINRTWITDQSIISYHGPSESSKPQHSGKALVRVPHSCWNLWL